MAKEDSIKQEEMRRHYDESFYYEGARDNYADTKSKFNQYTIKNVLQIYYPSKKEKILDVGCGWGNISLALEKEGFNVTGMDYSKKSIVM
jgi:2-polyprenyl-3-methyl-5-hydroxy-6-metoxy-1,4-benzoquinol methylase